MVRSAHRRPGRLAERPQAADRGNVVSDGCLGEDQRSARHRPRRRWAHCQCDRAACASARRADRHGLPLPIRCDRWPTIRRGASRSTACSRSAWRGSSARSGARRCRTSRSSTTSATSRTRIPRSSRSRSIRGRRTATHAARRVAAKRGRELRLFDPHGRSRRSALRRCACRGFATGRPLPDRCDSGRLRRRDDESRPTVATAISRAGVDLDRAATRAAVIAKEQIAIHRVDELSRYPKMTIVWTGQNIAYNGQPSHGLAVVLLLAPGDSSRTAGWSPG